jgi:hypothetical protein
MIRSFFVVILLVFLFGCDTPAVIKQPGKNYFLKYFGGDGNQTGVDLLVDTDGSFFVLGNSTQSTKDITKVYLAHVNALGEVIKQITLGEVDMDARDMEFTTDGKIAVVANKANSATPDILFSRFDRNLNRIDSILLFMGASSAAYGEYANSLTELTDGGFIIEGWVQGVDPRDENEELHLRVTNQLVKWPTGTQIWTENQPRGNALAPGSWSAVGVKTFEHTSNNFYTFGNSNYSSTTDYTKKFWAYNLAGNGGPNSSPGTQTETDDFSFLYPGSHLPKTLTMVSKVPAGGFLLAGYIEYPDSVSLKAAVTINSDSALNFTSAGVLKDRSLGSLGVAKTPFVTACASPYSNNIFLLANTYLTSSRNSDILLLKVNNALNNDPLSPWAPVKFGGEGDDTAAAVTELPDGHIIVLGTMQLGNPPEQNKIVMMKLNAKGQLSD